MKQLQIPAQLSIKNKHDFEWQLFYENMMRSRFLAQILIIFQVLLIIFHFLSSNTIFTAYFYMYSFLICVGISMLVLIRCFEKGDIHDTSRVKRFTHGLYTLVFTFLLWGAVLALIDQQDYGNVMAFVVNTMAISLLYHTSSRLFLSLFTIPTAVLIIGLPLFQASSNIIAGHYINLSIFLFFCWLVSKMLYTSNYRNFHSKVLLEQTNEQLELAIKKLKQLSIIDELTAIPNRRGFEEYIQQATSDQNRQQLSIFLLDIDSFKQYNDYYGHLAGDHVIRDVAQQIHACVDTSVGIAARYGGEEFIVAVFHAAQSEMHQLGEQLRTGVENLQIPHIQSANSTVVTISLGLATAHIETVRDIQQLIKQADDMLYKAKENGRNRLEVFRKEYASK